MLKTTLKIPAYGYGINDTVSQVYEDRAEWRRRAILNVAGMGKFPTDRTIRDYTRGIWGISL
ncbi:glycogen/starch/alpha-glucan phosphorylase [Desulfocicer niacini]